MPVIAESTPTYGNAVLYEEGREVGWTREGVTIYETVETNCGPGMVIGKVTATGKWKLCSPAAADGSQVAAGFVCWPATGNGGDFTVKAITDTRITASVRGNILVSKDGLRFGPGFTTQVQKDAAFVQLEALDIRNTVTV